jgi:WD40 repeat protein
MPSEHELRAPFPEGVVTQFENRSNDIPVDGLTNVCVLKNGLIVSADWQGKNLLRVWNPANGEMIKVMEGHTEQVYSLCAVGNGLMASASYDMTLRVWDVETGVCLKVLEGHKDYVRDLHALGDDQIVSRSQDGTVRVWDVVRGVCLHVIKPEGNYSFNTCVLGNQQIVIGGTDNMQIWNAQTGKLMNEIFGDYMSYPLFPLGSRYVLIQSGELIIVVDSSKEWTITKVLGTTRGRGIYKCMCALDDERFVTITNYGLIRVWDISKENPKILKIVQDVRCSDVAKISPTSFVTVGVGSPIKWDISNLENFPKPNRSGLLHRTQNAFRGAWGSLGSLGLRKPRAHGATVAPMPAGGGRISRKKRKTTNKRNKSKGNSGKSRKSRY